MIKLSFFLFDCRLKQRWHTTQCSSTPEVFTVLSAAVNRIISNQSVAMVPILGIMATVSSTTYNLWVWRWHGFNVTVKNLIPAWFQQEKMEGLTGFIVFDKGLRSFFHLSITELGPGGLLPVGTWNKENKANFTRKVVDAPLIQDSSLANKTVIVTSILVSSNSIRNINKKNQLD